MGEEVSAINNRHTCLQRFCEASQAAWLATYSLHTEQRLPKSSIARSIGACVFPHLAEVIKTLGKRKGYEFEQSSACHWTQAGTWNASNLARTWGRNSGEFHYERAQYKARNLGSTPFQLPPTFLGFASVPRGARRCSAGLSLRRRT